MKASMWMGKRKIEVNDVPDPKILNDRDCIVRVTSTAICGSDLHFIDKVPMNSVMNRSLTIRAGQCHVHRYMRPLLERIQRGEIDPSFVITHRLPLSEAPLGYELFNDKKDGCEKVVLRAA